MSIRSSIHRRLAAFGGDRRGNVLMMFGFALVPLMFATGMGVDYARAMQTQTKLNAIADAAALVAVSKNLMPYDDVTTANYVRNVFQVQAQPLVSSGLVSIDTLVVTAPTDGNGRRTATVTYTARTTNLFSRILDMATLSIHGTSQTTNATAPNIDFYMLLDVSASMALPTTSAGLTQVAASNGSSCQFACHSTNAITGTMNGGGTGDLYSVAKSYGLTLRIDAEGNAVSRLTSDAQSTQSKNGATYRMAIYSFEGSANNGFTTLQPLTPNLATAATKTTNLQPPLYAWDNCRTSACSSSDRGNADWDTATSDAFTKINALMPTPGTGIGAGSTPQQIMFVITDGLRDEFRPNGRPEMAIDTSLCDTIKARGTKIAVLYTEYLPQTLNNDSWSQSNVAPYLYQIEPALQNCASPGLYTKVSTNQDIYTALDQLFQNAVATARITR